MLRKTQRVLVIDDAPGNLEILSDLMSDECEVLCALNGYDGAELALIEQPDLILLDVMMPEMDGYEVCLKLKGDSRTRGIPIIFVTAMDQEEDEARGLEMGAVDYITKPINLPIVRARVRNHLELRRTEVTLYEQTAALHQEVAEHRAARALLQRQQEELEALNRGLEERVAAEVTQSREKDQALMQQAKMAAIGKLAAGVAHEINNPMAYISGNLNILSKYFDKMVRFDRMIREIAYSDTAEPMLRDAIVQGRVLLDMEHILGDGVELISESCDGAERVRKIVLALKSFSRVDMQEKEFVEISDCVENALNMCYNELSGVATIRKEYEPTPALFCNTGELNQVFLNLLVNAEQALHAPGEITIRCWHDDAFVNASVSDTGTGIPKDIRERIFEPFFTTKDIGKGTGLGLSVSHGIIRKHQGELLVESIVGQGSTFTVKIPRTDVAPA